MGVRLSKGSGFQGVGFRVSVMRQDASPKGQYPTRPEWFRGWRKLAWQGLRILGFRVVSLCGSFPRTVGPQHKPQNTIVPTTGTPKRYPPILGNSHIPYKPETIKFGT